MTGLMHSLAVELAQIRVNAMHPGIVADSPFWVGKGVATDRVKARTPVGRNVAMAGFVERGRSAWTWLPTRSQPGSEIAT